TPRAARGPRQRAGGRTALPARTGRCAADGLGGHRTHHPPARPGLGRRPGAAHVDLAGLVSQHGLRHRAGQETRHRHRCPGRDHPAHPAGRRPVRRPPAERGTGRAVAGPARHVGRPDRGGRARPAQTGSSAPSGGASPPLGGRARRPVAHPPPPRAAGDRLRFPGHPARRGPRLADPAAPDERQLSNHCHRSRGSPGTGPARHRIGRDDRSGDRPHSPHPFDGEGAPALRPRRRSTPFRYRRPAARLRPAPPAAPPRPRLGPRHRPVRRRPAPYRPPAGPAHRAPTRHSDKDRTVTFLAPIHLWWLLAAAVLLVAYLLMQRRRTEYALRFSNLALLEHVVPQASAWRRHVPAALFLLTIIVLILALARPAMDVQVPRERATILVAIDVSPSMAATDVAPDRLTSAKESAQSFIES